MTAEGRDEALRSLAREWRQRSGLMSQAVSARVRRQCAKELEAALAQPSEPGLDAAMAAVEAVLPDGWTEIRLTRHRHSAIGPYSASLHDGGQGAMVIRSGLAVAHGSKPSIALTRLAARLASEPTDE